MREDCELERVSLRILNPCSLAVLMSVAFGSYPAVLLDGNFSLRMNSCVQFKRCGQENCVIFIYVSRHINIYKNGHFVCCSSKRWVVMVLAVVFV